MGILDHLTCRLKNLYAGQETTVRTGHGTTDWFQIGKGVRQGCITLYTRQQKRHRYIEQSFGLCGRGRGWDDLGKWH